MMDPLPVSRPKWEIFCQVVDNFGDIGVCWRLARDLARREQGAVRLWVDDWAVLARICPAAAGVDPAMGGTVDGVEVRQWTPAFVASVPGEIVIEAFACELPPAQLEAMAAQAVAPVWINLEYLRAEPYVERMHGLPSPVQQGPAARRTKWFFYPGFTARTGGLLREHDLATRQAGFDRTA